jgi:hypothetical protein
MPVWVGEYDTENRQVVLHGPEGTLKGRGPMDFIKQLNAAEKKEQAMMDALRKTAQKKGAYRKR